MRLKPLFWGRHKLRTALARRQVGAPGQRVFLVHGRDDQAVGLMRRCLEDVGMQIILWDDAIKLTGSGTPYILDIVRAGMRGADATVVLFTEDEDVSLRPDFRKIGEQDVAGRQARPNVWLEAGMSLAIDKTRTILVELGVCRAASDLSGLNFLRTHELNDPKFIQALANRLRAAGCKPLVGSSTELGP